MVLENQNRPLKLSAPIILRSKAICGSRDHPQLELHLLLKIITPQRRIKNQYPNTYIINSTSN